MDIIKHGDTDHVKFGCLFLLTGVIPNKLKSGFDAPELVSYHGKYV